jgi:Zn-dependent peptidase ImmA (M78 family)
LFHEEEVKPLTLNTTDEIISRADKLVKQTGSRNPEQIARELGIIIKNVPFKSQKGVYKIIERNRFIFIKEDLDERMRKIVLLHEIGHDRLHRKQAQQFQEFQLFDMTSNTMEFEANLFAAQIALPDDEILEYIYRGYSVGQIAGEMESDINLVAIKVSDLSRRGYSFRVPEHKNNFL